MHDMDVWDWILMTPAMLFFWLVPVAAAVYVAVRLANRRDGNPAR